MQIREKNQDLNYKDPELDPPTENEVDPDKLKLNN